jgi:hypothetical protein
LFTRTIHDMAYDPVRDEIIVPQFYSFSILTFAGDANGDVAPRRAIFGPHTQMKNPQALGIDYLHGEIFVPQEDSVLVFPRDANGDVAPIRVLQGPDTGLRPQRVTLDPVHDLLIVSGNRGIRIFDRKANGNARPLRTITGRGAAGTVLMTTYPKNGLIVGAVHDDSPAGLEDLSSRFAVSDYIGVCSVFDNGDVPPRFMVGGPNNIYKDIRGVAVDAKNKNLIASDKTLNAIMTFHVPEVF